MASKTNKIEMTASLKTVWKRKDGKFRFSVIDRTDTSQKVYHFLLTETKALKLANQNYAFPIGVNLRLSGRREAQSDNLTFVKIISVDGYDVQSWAEKLQSPTVAPDVLTKAQKAIEEAEEENMRRRAPPEPPPPFKTPLEAYEKAMQRLRRQVRLKDPKLSKSDIWTIRDALNMLKETAGL